MLLALVLAATLAPLPHSPDLYVSGFFSASIQRYYGPRSATPGQSRGFYTQPVARRPWGLAFGPDGNLYVANFGTGSDALVRVAGPFAPNAGAPTTIVDGGAFFDVAFGPDGNLYVSGRGPVRRYDLVTGQLIGEFTSGQALVDVNAIAFGPDGDLYATNYDSCVTGPNGCTGSRSEIVHFDGQSGAFVETLSVTTDGSLAWDIAFGPDGALFVASSAGKVLRYDRCAGRTRAVHNFGSALFATRAGMMPIAIAFGPDRNLYVSDAATNSVLRFDGATGAFIDTFVASVDGGPRGLAFAIGPN
jgi:DNA-binding beta-propeller fold protein YncE